ncbi:MAG: hypothetical protein E4H13_14840, partial [Calditrichales bacterium]
DIHDNNGFGISSVNASGNTIVNNQLNANMAGGISVSNGNAIISNNTINANTGTGIALSAANENDVSDNIITTNGGDGLVVNGDNNILNKNTLSGNGGFGLSVTAGTGNQISDNSIGTNTAGGVSIAAATAQVTINTISGNYGPGISVNAANGNTISENIISANTGDGAVLNGDNNVLLKNTVSGNGGFGLSVTGGTGNQINENTFGTNTAGGVSIASATALVTVNTIDGNYGPGISLNSANGNSVSQNIISGNTGNGAIINGNDNAFVENTVTGNTGLGLSVTAGSGNQVTDNSFGTNSLGGISVSNSTAVLTGNSVTGNLGFGVSVNTAGGSVLTENEISGNASHGLIINGDALAVSDNTIYNNGVSGTGVGVFVESGAANAILYNSIYDNAGLGIKLNPSTNESQASPTLSPFYSWQDETALTLKGGTFIQGTLNSVPYTDYKIQFFANTNTDYREGQRYLGEVTVTSNLIGEAEILANFKNVIVGAGEVVSATATHLDGTGNPLSTSEFSVSIVLNPDEGDHYKVNTTLAGIPLHWKDGKGDYQIAPSVKAMNYDQAVKNGFNTWSTLEQLLYTYKNYTESEQWGGNADGVNNVVWIADSTEWISKAEAPVNVTAITRVRYNALTGEMIDVDIAFNGQPVSLTGLGAYGWATDGSSDKLDVQNVATHEIGHYSGLADLYNPGDANYKVGMKNNNHPATMYGRIDVGETYKHAVHPTDYTVQLDVTKYDIGGINYIYGNLGDVYYDIVL